MISTVRRRRFFLAEQFVLAILALNCTYAHRIHASDTVKIREKQIGTFDP